MKVSFTILGLSLPDQGLLLIVYLFECRRIPQLLWVRVRHALGQYLVERGTDGVTALNWYHRYNIRSFTVRKRSLGKVMFLYLSVSHSVHRGVPV